MFEFFYCSLFSLTRSQSVNPENQYHYDSTLPLPPPPPPPEDGIDGAVPLSPPQQLKSVLVGDNETVASSNVSTLRSLDGEEETKKKRVSKRVSVDSGFYLSVVVLFFFSFFFFFSFAHFSSCKPLFVII